jgi:adenine-specific DNA-methyltransferase
MTTQQPESEISALAHSLDINAERMAQLKALFPEAFTEGKLDVKRLAAALGENTSAGRENYELSWAGKADARAEIQKRTTATLRPDVANSVNWDATQNLYIEGENLEVLRTLQKAYFGKVKMIYIDPPYNTGNDSFVYPDDYSETLKEYQARTGQTDEAGFVNKQTLWKKNSKENGQFHSVWLSMMYPRLFLARNLLRDDGVIFVSIDDNEAADLKLLMDEIFGEENALVPLIWELPRGINAGHITRAHEYIFAYAKSKNNLDQFNRIDEGNSVERCNKKVDARHPMSDIIFPAGIRYEGDDKNFIGSLKGSEQLVYKNEANFSNGRLNNEVIISAGWTMKEMIQDWIKGKDVVDLKGQKIVEFFFKKNGKLYSKKNLHVQSIKSVPKKLPDTQIGRQELQNLFDGNDVFEYPKPVDLIKFLIRIAVKPNDLVLDFFSGSGVLGQAVLELNEEDCGNRQFICVQMPEVLDEDSEAHKLGYRTIADIGRVRVKKVIERIEVKRQETNKQKKFEDAEASALQALGFNAFKLAPSNFKEWRTDVAEVNDLLAQLDYHVDSTKPDSEAGSMVYELLLKLALPITTPIKCHDVGSAKVYMATPDSGKNVAMFFEALTDDVLAFILKAKPVKVLCLNKCFVDSQALTNFSLQLQDAAIALDVL